MKQKILDYFKDNKGSMSLFVIIFAVTIIMAIVASVFSAGDTTKAALAASGGIIAMMGIDKIEKSIGMQLGDSKDPAILGIISGVLIALI